MSDFWPFVIAGLTTGSLYGLAAMGHGQSKPRSLEKHYPKIHPRLRDVIHKCIEPDPNNRFQSMKLVLNAIRSGCWGAAGGKPSVTVGKPPSGRASESCKYARRYEFVINASGPKPRANTCARSAGEVAGVNPAYAGSGGVLLNNC